MINDDTCEIWADSIPKTVEFYEKLGFGGFREKISGNFGTTSWRYHGCLVVTGIMEFYDFPETVGNFIIPMAMRWLTITYYNYNWLVLWNMTFIFPNSWDDDSI